MIRTVRPREVKADLLRLWTDNLGVNGSVEEKYQLLYQDAPDTPEMVFALALDGAVVGTAGVLIRRFRVGDREVRSALLANLAVDRAHRSFLPALKVVRAGREHALSSYAFAYGFPNRQAEGVFRRAPYKELGRMARYTRVLRHASYVERAASRQDVPRLVARVAEHPLVTQAASAAVDWSRLAMAVPLVARAVVRHRLAWLEAPDDRIDALWAAARHEYPIAGARTAQFLRWRYPPSAACALALLEDREQESPRAYALVQREGAVAHVRDLFGHRADLAPLLALLLPALYAQGVASVSVRYLGAPDVVGTLSAFGFTLRQADRMISIGVGESMAERAAELEDAYRWHLTDLDEDA